MYPSRHLSPKRMRSRTSASWGWTSGKCLSQESQNTDITSSLSTDPNIVRLLSAYRMASWTDMSMHSSAVMVLLPFWRSMR